VLDSSIIGFSTRKCRNSQWIPTTENIAITIWQRLAPKLKTAQLHRVRVYETPDLFVDFYGEA
jgi:6-pyruvoyl-tetrahydropterin synthase